MREQTYRLKEPHVSAEDFKSEVLAVNLKNGFYHSIRGAGVPIWQLLMAGQVPIVGFFAIKWLPRAPRKTLPVLALQVGAALASMAPVFFLHL